MTWNIKLKVKGGNMFFKVPQEKALDVIGGFLGLSPADKKQEESDLPPIGFHVVRKESSKESRLIALAHEIIRQLWSVRKCADVHDMTDDVDGVRVYLNEKLKEIIKDENS